MEKQKRWQAAIILAVLFWTVYNILPTIIYYAKPLNQPIDERGAREVEIELAERVNGLVPDAVDWIKSFCDMIGVHPSKIIVDSSDPSVITFSVASDDEGKRVEQFLPRAGMMISGRPSQIFLDSVNGTSIRVTRRVNVTIDEAHPEAIFSFVAKRDAKGKPTTEYFDIVAPRFVDIAYVASGDAERSASVATAIQKNDAQAIDQFVTEIGEWQNTLNDQPTLRARLLQHLFAGANPEQLVDSFIQTVQTEAKRLDTELKGVQSEVKSASDQGKVSSPALIDKEHRLKTRSARYASVSTWLASQKSTIAEAARPYTKEDIRKWLQTTRSGKESSLYALSLGNRHPLLRVVGIDWTEDRLRLELHPDVAKILSDEKSSTEQVARQKDMVSRMLMNEIARISRATNEDIKGEGLSYSTPLSQNSSSNNLILLDLKTIADSFSNSVRNSIVKNFQPQSIDLDPSSLPRLTGKEYLASPADIQDLSLVVFSPLSSPIGVDSLKPSSLYVIVRGGMTLLDCKKGADAELQNDLDDLANLLQRRGFTVYPGKTLGASSEFAQDIIFELPNFYEPLLEATRESFFVPGLGSVALLECGTVEQRILAANHVDDSEQEDLIKWREAWQSAQVSLQPADRFSVPKPTKNILWSNLKRSWKKYWRGDDSRIIRWGLDLSGGKSVRVGLLDQTNKPVTKMEDLKQATSELYSRLNKMGVSERTLRIENGTILIDFPGVQGVSASELVKASAMYFHVVNEKFGPMNADLAKQTQAFLQEVWNEAVVTNAKDHESINRIASRKIAAVKAGLVNDQNIKALLDAGLVLEDTSVAPTTAFDDHVSMIARWSGDDPSEWPSHSNPLIIVFKNYALEGCNLENVHPSYDPSKGNILIFNVRGTDSRRSEVNPRDEFHTWTSQFCQENILGTPREQFSRSHGWRMAVILNGVVVNAPALSSPLRDSAMITGNFTQREVQRLATNLQAGSLSFTPKILSEQNVSPELGVKERHQGIVAATLSTIAVVGIMVGYYHFAGVVASVAVLFNLLIIWAVMQNIEAAMTLPAIAGIVLTVAMAVDANVLVFERIREEFSFSNRLASAIGRGYQKAFSAIVDSNLTTLIAAFILTQFDCGPVRGFAMTLIIGLVSSMFTSLFVTKYYFAGWVEDPRHTTLTMSNWIRSANFDFLSWKKVSYIISAVVLVVGIVVGACTWKSMLGMDFTGGYALVVEATSSSDLSPREVACKALEAKGIQPAEIQIRELGRPTALRIQLSASLEQPGRPFNALPESLDSVAQTYEYQRIPRLAWVVSALEQGGLVIRASDRSGLVQQWTAISGQFSDAMRNNAILALGLSMVAVLIYIAIRFEWKYAISAVLALAHDVVLTLAVIAILRLFGLPVQINLEMIGALMTIIGYSLNDTIIVFDRVREDLALYHKKRFSEIVNMALNSTLSRTLMTSGITLVVLLCLVLLGGPAIFGFSFIMFLGVFLGTLSSLFIAGPLLVFFHQREDMGE